METKIYKVIIPTHYVNAEGEKSTSWWEGNEVDKQVFYYSTIQRAKENHPINLYKKCLDENGIHIKKSSGENGDYEYYESEWKYLDINTNEIVWSNYFWKNEKMVRNSLTEHVLN